MNNIDFLTATEAELADFLQAHPAHAGLLRATAGMDEQTIACLCCMAEAYSNGATDAEALATLNRALRFYGRGPVTTGPKITG